MDAIHQAQQDGVVLGLSGISGDNPVPRLDIDELLLTKPDTFNLFLLAIDELQRDEHATDKMGFQQIAGIHGLPMALWDGVQAAGKAGGAGYCAHSRPTFPTWHRPYLAMMEQTLYSKMEEIANRFPDEAKPKYLAALQEFRFPYWDYYRPRNEGTTVMPGIKTAGGTTSFGYDFSLPQVFVVQSVMVRRTSDDTLQPLDNPLKKFKFLSTGGMTPNDWALAQGFSQIQTVRYPTSINDLEGSVTTQSSILNREREGNVKIILQMISDNAYNSYASFASDSLSPGPSGSVEDIHGNYHVMIGGHPSFGSRRGHMSVVPTSAFDPVFWMHHCLIDRWLAIWQAAHPDKWYDGQFWEFINGQRQVADIGPLANEDALPFRHPQGGYWNGNLSYDTKTFGYVYQDALGSAQEVVDNFSNHYSWATRSRPGEPPLSPPDDMQPLNVQDAQVFQFNMAGAVSNTVRAALNEGPQAVMTAIKTAAGEAVGLAKPVATSSDTVAVPTNPTSSETEASEVAFTNMAGTELAQKVISNPDESKYDRDWYVDNVVERLALNGSFTIFYFIGNFNKDDVTHYALQPTMAGINHIFTSSREACDNCGVQDEEGHLISGTKVITPMLLDYVEIGQLADLSPANVVPFLISNLKWRIVDMNGTIANPRTVSGFRVGVSSKLTPRDGTAGGPIYEEYPQVVERIIAASS